jgi:hypothetical protein
LTFFIVGFVVAAHMYPHHLYPLTTPTTTSSGSGSDSLANGNEPQFVISSGDATIDAQVICLSVAKYMWYMMLVK